MILLFTGMLKMSLTASYVAIAVIFLRLFLKKLPRSFSYCLWGLVFLRLLCPVTFGSPFSILPSNNSSLPSSGNDFSKVFHFLSFLWIIGAVILLFHVFYGYLRLKNRLSTSTIHKDNIYISDRIKTPFVLGLIKPKIYLPLDISNNELEFILLHEQFHIKRFDYLIKIFAYIALALHWFNPFAWISYQLMTKDMEISCDEGILKKSDKDFRIKYSITLFNLSSKKSGLLFPIAFSEGNTKSRIKNVLIYKRPAGWKLVSALFVLIIISISLITDPKVNMTKDNTETVMDQNEYHDIIGTYDYIQHKP